MRKMPAMRKIKSENFISGFQYSKQHSGIGLCTGMWLHIRIVGPKQLFHAVNGQLLHFINYFTSAIIAATGITFCILIRQATAHRIQNLLAYEIFRGNQFNAVTLALELLTDER